MQWLKQLPVLAVAAVAFVSGAVASRYGLDAERVPAPQGEMQLIIEAESGLPALPGEIMSRYTQHASTATTVRTFPLIVTPDLPPAQRAAVLLAAAEWNHVLNGHARFVVAAGANVRPLWTVMQMPGGVSYNARALEPVGLTLPSLEGGVVLLYTERLQDLELRRVVLHELGHVLGLGHNDRSRLMSARYFGDYQKCVDGVSAEMVSNALRIPLQELNWCGPAARAGHF